MKRRTFIFSILILIAASLVGFVTLLTFKVVIKRVLKKDLGYLKLSDAEIDKFINEAEKNNYWKKEYIDRNKQYFFRIYHVFRNPVIPLPYQFKYDQLRARIVGNFLLSTDFFRNKMDESKEVRYIGLYDAYTMPCSNPFSSVYYS